MTYTLAKQDPSGTTLWIMGNKFLVTLKRAPKNTDRWESDPNIALANYRLLASLETISQIDLDKHLGS